MSSSTFKLEHIHDNLLKRVESLKQLISNINDQLTKVKELLEAIKRSNISIDQQIKAKVSDMLKWSEDPKENLDNLKKTYATLVNFVLLKYLSATFKLDQCTSDYMIFHKEVQELITKVGLLKDWKFSIYIERAISNISEIERDPCYLIKQPQVLDLIYSIDQLRSELTKRVCQIFSCELTMNVEKAIGSYIASSKSLDDLRDRYRSLKEVLDRANSIMERNKTYGILSENAKKIIDETESQKYATYIARALASSLKDSMVSLVDSIVKYRSNVCDATSYDEVVESLKMLARTPDDVVSHVNDRYTAFRSRVERIASKFKIQLPDLGDLRIKSIDEIPSKLQIVKTIDVELSRVLEHVLGSWKDTFERLVQILEEGGGRPVRIDRSLLQRLRTEDLDILIKLCIEGILDCAVGI